MSRRLHQFISRLIVLVALASTALVFTIKPALAQNAFDKGTPAESKGGLSGLSTYNQDKIETVNLANGNLAIHLPLATLGGRGSASYTVALAYNSKLWHGQHDTEVITFPTGEPPQTIHHNAAAYDDGTLTKPNLIPLGSGWFISKGPAIRTRKIEIDPITCGGIQGPIFKYLLTKVWIVLADGSEVEMRDDLTDGAPYLNTLPCNGSFDRDRGRSWHSTDGSAITYVTDAANGVVTDALGGYVFLSDGTRLRINSNGKCTRITDPNGNHVGINYIAVSNSVIYTDTLGRQVTLQPTASGATVTITGYDGLADRVISVDTGPIGAIDGFGNPINLRSDFWSLQQPFFSGDYQQTSIGEFDHASTEPHTDVFFHSDMTAAFTDITGSTAVATLNLLDGRSFRFRYNQFGELAEIVYPGGGVSQIDYAPYEFGSAICEGGPTIQPQLNRRVVQRRTLSDGATVDGVWTYARGLGNVGGTNFPTVTVEAHHGTITGPLMLSEKHFFLALDAEYRTCHALKGSNGTANEKFENAREFRAERLTGTGTQIETKTWVQRTNVVWGPDPGSSTNAYANDPFHGQEQPPNDPRVTIEDSTLENGKLKRLRYNYDNFNNVTRTREYDFGAGIEGVLLRDTTRTYLGAQNGYCYTNLNGIDGFCGGGLYSTPEQVIHRLRLVANETVKDGSGNVEAYTEYEYDNYLNDGGNHAAIQANPGMIRYDTVLFVPFVSQSQPRGNATSVKRLLTGSPPPGVGTYVTAFTQYDEAGSVVKTIDPRGFVTTISYADNFGDGSNPDSGTTGTNGLTYAFATSATNALGHVSKTQHHYSRGVPTGVKDPNGTIAKTEYNDPYDRPTRVTAAFGLLEATKTEMSYPTATPPAATTVSKQLDATRWLAYKTTYDGFGRPLIASESEDGNHASSANFTISSKRIYDSLGRAKFATNPYRAQPATTDGWSRSTFDLGGRVTEIATFSGPPSPPPPDTGTNASWTGSVTTVYASEVTTVTDQAGKVRRSVSDGLGRLKQVIEDPNVLAFSTTYGYDARGNLKTVTQGTQPQRTFSYDLLSRLMSANNPESGAINYSYDANSNLQTRLDARGITTTYAYDALNRVTSRIYTNDPQSTPAVFYKYDAQTLTAGAPAGFNRGSSTGRLVAATYGTSTSSAGNYTGYDQLGRATSSFQQTDVQNYGFSYGYNLASEMISQTYPSGRVVQPEYDAAARLAGVKNQASGLYWAGAAATDAANRIQYSAHGAASATKLGNGKWEHTNFNSRLQPLQIGLGTSATNSSLLQLDYTYNSPGQANNNGNVLSQNIVIGATTISQGYTYDALNRLQSASEDTGASWSQSYGYDRFGNRWVSASTGYTLSSLTPQSQGAFNPANNRLFASGYDSAGNQTADAQSRTFTYDAENRQTTFNGAVGKYFYDGDGRRVKKIDDSGTTVFVYNSGGQLIAEYHSDPVPPPAGGGGTSYLTSDHLGSTRVVTKADGTVKARYDYLPFGEELTAGVGARTTGLGYSAADSTKQKFTQKERDNESGLDYFLARYYSSAQGRFSSVDPQNVVFEKEQGRNANERAQILQSYLVQPQNWNRYAYTRNNPLAYRDANGRCAAPSGLSQGNVGICIEAFIASPTIGSGAIHGLGDNRGFAANDPTKTFRIQVSGTVWRSAFAGNAKLTGQPGVSQAVVLGIQTERSGRIEWHGKITNVDKDGNIHLQITMTGINGFSGFPGAPKGDIQVNVNLVVTPDGKVGVEGGDRTAYPSVGIYSYNMGPDGKPTATTLAEFKETTPAALTQPTVPIQPVPPTCDCNRKPEEDRKKD